MYKITLSITISEEPPNGSMAEWQNGRMAEWQNGSMAEWNGPSRPPYRAAAEA